MNADPVALNTQRLVQRVEELEDLVIELKSKQSASEVTELKQLISQLELENLSQIKQIKALQQKHLSSKELFQQNETYQLWRSQLAIGSGHLTGAGFNSSRMKENYLPEAHTDFIMAIVGEELGFVTIASVLLLYVLLTLAAFCIAMAAPDPQGTLLGFGIGLMFWLGAYINFGVVCGLLPTTGISAPFVSYGGSGLLGSWIAIGILLNIAHNSPVHDEEGEIESAPSRSGTRSTVTGRMLA